MTRVHWGAKRQAKLIAAYEAGGDWRAIARRMRMTKGQVLGRLWRSGLTLTGKRRKVVVELDDVRTMDKVRREMIEPVALGVPTQLLRLHPLGCKWSIGLDEEGIHIFCNKPRQSGAYCSEHSNPRRIS